MSFLVFFSSKGCWTNMSFTDLILLDSSLFDELKTALILSISFLKNVLMENISDLNCLITLWQEQTHLSELILIGVLGSFGSLALESRFDVSFLVFLSQLLSTFLLSTMQYNPLDLSFLRGRFSILSSKNVSSEDFRESKSASPVFVFT